MIWIIIILGILLVVAIYAIINLLKKYETLERSDSDKLNWINTFRKNVTFLNSRLQEIDVRGSFSSDDEVGIFFLELKRIQELLNDNFVTDEGKQNETNP